MSCPNCTFQANVLSSTIRRIPARHLQYAARLPQWLAPPQGPSSKGWPPGSATAFGARQCSSRSSAQIQQVVMPVTKQACCRAQVASKICLFMLTKTRTGSTRVEEKLKRIYHDCIPGVIGELLFQCIVVFCHPAYMFDGVCQRHPGRIFQQLLSICSA